MGYLVQRRGKNWRLVHRHDGGASGITWRCVSKDKAEFAQLGLRKDMEFAEAKAAVANVQAEDKLKRELERRARIETRLKLEGAIKSAWLPEGIVHEFETKIIPSHEFKERHWVQAQKLIASISMDPSEWAFRKKEIWQYFKDQCISKDYARRILRVMNFYMYLFCTRRGKNWMNVPPPTGSSLNTIVAANKLKRKGKHETFPLTPELLKSAGDISSAELNWLKVSLFFGLRVEEMKRLTSQENPDSWYVSYEDKRFPFVLHVLQHKLVRDGVEISDAWKDIPACEPEQIELLPVLQSPDTLLKVPLHKTLKKHIHERLSRRSGRAYFMDLMQLRGYSEIIISKWMGHTQIRTGRKSYQKTRVAYFEPKRVKDES